MPTPCMQSRVCVQSTWACAYTHHFNVVKDSRHLLYPFYHLLRVFGIFSLPSHLLIKRHLPAHSWVLHLKPRVKYLECIFINVFKIIFFFNMQNNKKKVYSPCLANADCCARTPSPLHLCLSTREGTKIQRTLRQSKIYYSLVKDSIVTCLSV